MRAREAQVDVPTGLQSRLRLMPKKPLKEEIPYAKSPTILWAYLAALTASRMHDRVPISRQQTTDSNTVGRHPRPIRNELSERNRRGAFARGHPACSPGTHSAGRRTRAIYDRRGGLRPAAGSIRFFARWAETVARRSKVRPRERDCARRFRVSGFRCC